MKTRRQLIFQSMCLFGWLFFGASCNLSAHQEQIEKNESPIPTIEITVENPSIAFEREETPTVIPEQQLKPITLGYYTGEQASYNAIREFSPYIQIVSASIYFIGSDGTIAGQDDLDVANLNRDLGIQTLACISNYNGDYDFDFDPERARLALVERKDEFIDSLLWLALENEYAGINIDFENIAFSEDVENDRNVFSKFISDLAIQLHDNGLILVVSVPAKFQDLPEEPWSYTYDYAALGESADYLQLMTYDEHGTWSEEGYGGEPGPVSGIDWIEQVLTYAVSLVEPSRLLIGLPAYGYDWNLSTSDIENEVYSVHSFPWNDVQNMTIENNAEIRWDEESASPFSIYEVEGQQHEIWFENSESIRAKSSLVKQYDLAGISVWAVGYEDESFWQAAITDFE